MARALRAWAINRGEKNSVRNLQYGPRTRLVRGMYADFNTDSADACILVMACVDCARACSKKPSQHANTTYRNIVGHNMLRAFGHPVVTCCDMSRVENRTTAHA